jgi:hypothetical protein
MNMVVTGKAEYALQTNFPTSLFLAAHLESNMATKMNG